MAKKRGAHDEEAWTNAKNICRLTARQVEMARALGMNPRKLPGLRPSPQQHWKLPVGEFIEERYRKRFGAARRDHDPREAKPSSRKLPAAGRAASVSEHALDPASQMNDLVCYLLNLADDLQQWLAHGLIDPKVLSQVREELRTIAKALETGAPISTMPAISGPRPTRCDLLRWDDQERTFDDDDIPF